jgi:hypothetical protein
MAKKEPAWRQTYADPQSMHKPYKQEFEIPTYVRRLLVRCGNKKPEETAAEIVEQAMLLHVRSLLRPPRFAGHGGPDYLKRLLCGRYVSGNEGKLCAALERETPDLMSRFEILNEAMVVCVSNTVYGYFFVVDRRTDFQSERAEAESRGPFLNWVQHEWGKLDPLPRKQIKGSVVNFEKGDWPLHPRLIPGHPWAEGLEFRRED